MEERLRAGVIVPPWPRHAPVRHAADTGAPERPIQGLAGTPMRLLRFPGPKALRRRAAEKESPVPPEVEAGAPFCANPGCALHVRLIDHHVKGGGNWVTLPDGRIFGRGRYGNALLCDACGTQRGPVYLAAAFTN